MMLQVQHSKKPGSRSIMSMRALTPWLVSLLVAVAPAAATTTILRCNACSPAAALQVALAAGVGGHVVFDLANNRTMGFVVEPGDQYPGALTATVVEVDPLIKDQVAAFSALYAATGGSMIISSSIAAEDIDLPELGGKTAFDIVEDANLRGRTADVLWQSPPSRGVDSALLAVIESVKASGLIHGLQASAVFIVTSAEGSKVSFKVDLETQRMAYIRGSARTSTGQSIPETNKPFEVTGTYNFPANAGLHDDASRFISHLASLGIPVEGSPGTHGGGSTITCTFDGVRVSCRVLPG